MLPVLLSEDPQDRGESRPRGAHIVIIGERGSSGSTGNQRMVRGPVHRDQKMLRSRKQFFCRERQKNMYRVTDDI